MSPAARGRMLRTCACSSPPSPPSSWLPPANAAEIHVNIKDDLLDPLDGKCSLREAIIMASFNTGTNGCTLGDASATDTIVLPVSTFTLTRGGTNEDDGVSGDLDVRPGGPLVIDGNGATISAASLDRVLEVHVGGSLTLRDITIRGGLAPSGQPGGGILNLGTLAVVDGVVTLNRIDGSGAGFDGGSGGGIFSTDTLSLTNTTVSDNDAGSAGPAPGGPGFDGGRAVTVAFAPTRAGSRTGALRIGSRSLPLSGTALAPCIVPRLKGKTRKAARRALLRAHCTLGTVTRRGRGRRIRASKPKAGSVLAAGAAVDVVVNRRRPRHRR